VTLYKRNNPRNTRAVELSRRDWILLPMLSLLTICLMVVSMELIARRVFPESPPFVQSCLEPGASWAEARAIPNSVCRDKMHESQMVEYRFNSCGHRTRLECGIKRPDTYRIVLAGSSFAMGHMVREDKTYAALLPISLSKQTGRRVELYNEGMVGINPHIFALRFDEVLAAKPDLILWTLTPWDIQNAAPPNDIPNPDPGASSLEKLWSRVKLTFATRSAPDAMRFIGERFWSEGKQRFADSEIGAMLQHFIYQSKSQYVKSSLMAGGTAAYLQSRPSSEWERSLRYFDSDAAEVEARARAANVPLVAVLVPNRVQAAMISLGEWPTSYDPYELDRELRTIIVSHGETYIDILPEFRVLQDPEQKYFPVDGHPDIEGHAMISQLLVKELTNGSVPSLRVDTQLHVPEGPAR
jgi:hypothetical protein